MIVGVGVDMVQIERIAKLDNKGLAEKLLTKHEYQSYQNLTSIRRCEWLAGRFAAKEAIFKALPSGAISTISQIEIEVIEEKPSCKIEGYIIHLSISHEKEYAIAYAICESSER